MGTASGDPPELVGLSEDLRKGFPGFLKVESFKRLSKGAVNEMYDLQLAIEGKPSRRACLRKLSAFKQANKGPTAAEGGKGIEMKTEAAVMTLCRENGVPIPEVFCVCGHGGALKEDGYVMDWIDGETLGKKIVNMHVNKPGLLGVQLGQAIAGIHKCKVPDTLASQLATTWAIDAVDKLSEQLEEIETYNREKGEPFDRPILHFLCRWLRESAPKPQGPARLLHGDYRNGNLIVGEEGLRAVIDWEGAHFGDIHDDLGWICINTWRFGRPDKVVGGFGDVEEFVKAYEDAGGDPVNEEYLKWWIILGSTRWGMICLNFAHEWRDGGTPEWGAIGRRTSEGEWDALSMVLGPQKPLPDALPVVRAPELLRVVDTIVKQLSQDLENGSHAKYLSLVASNTLKIAAREWIHEWSEETSLLRDILAQGPNLATDGAGVGELRRSLCDALDAGKLRLSAENLLQYLRQLAHHYLIVDQPNFGGLDRTPQPADPNPKFWNLAPGSKL